jgi:hypothetical protein
VKEGGGEGGGVGVVIQDGRSGCDLTTTIKSCRTAAGKHPDTEWKRAHFKNHIRIYIFG